MTELGAAVFSVTRNKSVIMLKLIMSSPLPPIAVNIPPMKPVMNNTPAFHALINITDVNVRLFRYLLSRNKANPNEKQKDVNMNFLTGGLRCMSRTSSPTTTPPKPPRVQNMRALLSTLNPMNLMVNIAAVKPNDCIKMLKSRAVFGEISNARVITGNTITPPLIPVIPENKRRLIIQDR
ncbi:unnamed protein product [Owenia fusiformis]|uniref:Uncharacterized protein n=1 Tax=Owenia fusiformis TaxID=6347 RepID=A0A8J1XLK9_OWEFU|nr:unnamed protein product [Owenia fusiformis]